MLGESSPNISCIGVFLVVCFCLVDVTLGFGFDADGANKSSERSKISFSYWKSAEAVRPLVITFSIEPSMVNDGGIYTVSLRL